MLFTKDSSGRSSRLTAAAFKTGCLDVNSLANRDIHLSRSSNNSESQLSNRKEQGVGTQSLVTQTQSSGAPQHASTKNICAAEHVSTEHISVPQHATKQPRQALPVARRQTAQSSVVNAKAYALSKTLDGGDRQDSIER